MSAARPRPARPTGRHLLASARLAAAIVRDAGVRPGDLVLDVGAGSGMLTRPLLAVGARVVAIEPDRRLARRLRRACPEATVVEVDARTLAWPDEPFRVVANLPFAVAADLSRSLFGDPRLRLRSADLIVEWDFAVKRTRLWPSTALAAIWGAWYELSVVRRLEPAAFAPRPSVAAGVLRARRRADPLVAPAEAAGYAAFVARSFRREARARELDCHAWADRWSSGRGRTLRRMRAREAHP